MRKLEALRRLLEEQSTLTLATVDADGAARATPLLYVPEFIDLPEGGLRLFWFSSASSVHSRNCAGEPMAAAAVYAETDEWRKIRGVQMRGRVEAVRDREARLEIAARYVERFRLSTAPRLALGRATLYCLRVEWIRYMENARRLGYRFEMEWAVAEPGKEL